MWLRNSTTLKPRNFGGSGFWLRQNLEGTYKASQDKTGVYLSFLRPHATYTASAFLFLSPLTHVPLPLMALLFFTLSILKSSSWNAKLWVCFHAKYAYYKVLYITSIKRKSKHFFSLETDSLMLAASCVEPFVHHSSGGPIKIVSEMCCEISRCCLLAINYLILRKPWLTYRIIQRQCQMTATKSNLLPSQSQSCGKLTVTKQEDALQFRHK